MYTAQIIVVVILFVIALLWLLRKYIGPSKDSHNCGNGDCGCN
ncbi:hypothetical protein JCM19294_2514 [Nonlabens tegetincola]|uniref:FeoB-associated Cys-rich membrane protein n=1 Tax=Nonlabens tegetincola TaxID=323273 RepID=A0A090Q0L9_9FLAO|nr:hypothetical protein JCM19294_2514 [Nonlabens tegetincola]